MSDYSDLILGTAGLAAYWRLGEIAGTTGTASVIDSSGNARHGTPTSVTFGVAGAVFGDTDTSATFGGSSSVNAGTSTPLATDSDWTLEAWVYPTTLGNANTIVAKRSAFNSAGNQIGVNLHVSKGVSVAKSNLFSNSGVIVGANQWTHLVVRGTASGYSVWRNGVLQAIGSGLDGNTLATADWRAGTAGAQPIGIGRLITEGSEGFVGRLDEISLYSRALTSTEITAHYRAGVGSLFQSAAPRDAFGSLIDPLNATGGPR